MEVLTRVRDEGLAELGLRRTVEKHGCGREQRFLGSTEQLLWVEIVFV
jgi:hypothetical protein